MMTVLLLFRCCLWCHLSMKLHPRTCLCSLISLSVNIQAEDTWEPEDSFVDTVNGVRTVTKELQTYLAAETCRESSGQTHLRTPSADESCSEEPIEHQSGKRFALFSENNLHLMVLL